MKKTLALIFTAIMALSLISCSNKSQESEVKSTLLPENASILQEDEFSLYLELKMSYAELVEFYEKAIETLGASGEVADFGAPSSSKTWGYTGTYGDDNTLLSITIAESEEENICTVSIHF